jgi:adenylyl-sulfate kinase
MHDPNHGFVVWLTGLSGAGKTTLAQMLEKELDRRGFKVEVLDGDLARTHLSKGLGFSKKDRDEHIRRIGFVCRLLSRNSVVAVAAAISPYRELREEVRVACGGRFVEVYIKCGLETLLRRDVKGLYQKALSGEIPNFTGISDPYEEPLQPEILVHTDHETPEQSSLKIIHGLEKLGYLSPEKG